MKKDLMNEGWFYTVLWHHDEPEAWCHLTVNLSLGIIYEESVMPVGLFDLSGGSDDGEGTIVILKNEKTGEYKCVQKNNGIGKNNPFEKSIESALNKTIELMRKKEN